MADNSRYELAQLVGLGFGKQGSPDGAFPTYTYADSFSGYGQFTPITVSSHTILTDANLERDKSRN